MPTDKLQAQIEVGSIVNIPCVVTAVTGTPTQPTLTLTPQYKDFAGAQTAITGVATIQVTLKP